ncbi:MAG: CocE/NonD family hydrolase [Pseudomonadota bacterium]
MAARFPIALLVAAGSIFLAVASLDSLGALRGLEFVLLAALGAISAATVLLPCRLWRKSKGVAVVSALFIALPAVAITLWCRTHLLPFTMESRYVTAADGTAIALDIYLPRQVPAEGVPTILSQTRYLRSVSSRFPVSIIRSPATFFSDRFTEAGYAYIRADVRGTGASGGAWPVPWTQAEVSDGAAIADWIIAQPWSNGSIGSQGISYDGTSVELLLSNGHSAVRGAVVAFSLYDAFDDIIMPGGIWLHSFIERWDASNKLLDENRPFEAFGVSSWLATTVTPAQNHPEAITLSELVLDRDNGSLLKRLETLEGFRAAKTFDEQPLSSSFQFDRSIETSGAQVLAISGWMDGAYPDAALKRFINRDNVKVLLGPWDHGGRQAISPCTADDGAAPLDYAAAVVDFNNSILRGEQTTDYAQGSAIRYFTMCHEDESGWRSTEQWPPEHVKLRSLGLGADGAVTVSKEVTGSRNYLVDRQATRGSSSRWWSYINSDGRPIGYPDLHRLDNSLLLYESAPLLESVTITGNALLDLRISVEDGSDAAVFAYLEDLGPEGDVRYVTEGQLRASLRQTAPASQVLYKDTGPHRTFTRTDLQPLEAGVPVDLQISLQPVSYTLRAGRRIRVALSGADVDNFRQPPEAAQRWRVEHGGRVTQLHLPVEKGAHLTLDNSAARPQ